MVAVQLKSRLGNQCFELAAAYHLAKTLNQDLSLVKNGSKDYVDYDIILNGRNVITDTSGFKVIKEDDKQSYIDLLEQANDSKNIYLQGYFQSDKYFTREEAEELFKIPEEIKDKYGHLEDAVCLSVRRGDYLKYSTMFISPSKEWFEKCYHKYFDGKDVVIASDDIDYCKKNFKFANMTFIENDPIETMLIKSVIKNHIISPSTFAWWSAYLSKGMVVAPEDWVGVYLKRKGFNEADKYVEGWIKEPLK